MPWSTLQIEATDDVRVIKRAYAKLLKQNRPDDNPQGFQQLHHAYKHALGLAESQPRHARPEPEPATDIAPADERRTLHTEEITVQEAQETGELTLTAEPLASWSTHIAFTDDPPYQQDDGDYHPQAYEDLLEQCQALLNNGKGCQHAEAWLFLAQNPLLLEASYQQMLGRALFVMLVEHEEKIGWRESHMTSVVPDVLLYLNELFFWERQRQELSHGQPDYTCEKIFSVIDDAQLSHGAKGLRGGKKLILSKEKPREEPLEYYFFGSVLVRAIAGAIELFVVHLVLDIVAKAPFLIGLTDSENLRDIRLALVIPVYILAAALFEKSRMQATPMKWLFGLRVMTRNFKPVGWKEIILRSALFSVIPLLIFLGSQIRGIETIILIIFFINCYSEGDLIQDRLSGTHVVDLDRSRKHQQKRAG